MTVRTLCTYEHHLRTLFIERRPDTPFLYFSLNMYDSPHHLSPLLLSQIRVVHGKEPPHFLAMFQGRLVIYDGGRVGQATEETPEDTHLIQVSGTVAQKHNGYTIDIYKVHQRGSLYTQAA